MFTTDNPALLIIDVQQAIDHFKLDERSQPDAEDNIQGLLHEWRRHKLPIIHVRHSSRHQGSPYHATSDFYGFKAAVEPLHGETVITKRENCAFLGTELEHYLAQAQIKELVITGVLLNHSVDATVRVASGLGFQVTLPNDACAASSLTLADGRTVSAADTHQIMLANLRNEYADISPSIQVISALKRRESAS